MKVGIIGASGYVGGETIRLLVNHPEVEIVAVTSRKHAGEYLHRIQPSLKGFTDIKFSELDYDKISSECDLVFTAVPHGTATEIVKTFYDRGTRVIDLSADYRLHNPDDYGKWYGWEHPHPNGPTMQTNSPEFATRLMSFMAFNVCLSCLKYFTIFFASISGITMRPPCRNKSHPNYTLRAQDIPKNEPYVQTLQLNQELCEM